MNKTLGGGEMTSSSLTGNKEEKMCIASEITTLCDKHAKFKAIEQRSAKMGSVPQDTYLVIRLDGIGLSKRCLKDHLENKLFQKVMLKAAQDTYYVMRRKTPSNAQQIFLGVLIASDEVSFILNTSKSYLDHSIMKLVTTMASTFSCFFTKNGLAQDPQTKLSGSFDGRPLVLSTTEEVKEYVAYRAATYNRNTMAKALRLKGVPDEELFGDNENDTEYYFEKYRELRLSTEGINKGCIFLSPCKDNSKLTSYQNKSLSKFMPLYSRQIDFTEQNLRELNSSMRSEYDDHKELSTIPS